MNLATVFPLITLALAAALAALIGLRWWMSQPERVLAEIDALDLPADTKAAIRADCAAAQKADQRTWWYDLSAPLVMLLVLPFVPRSADRLPRLFARWDNNVSLNGDGHGWLDDAGQWHHGRDGAPRPPGAHLYSYDDPLYGGDAYYAEGHHPRSFWARYVWVGLRNRASQLSVTYGVEVAERPVCISGDPAIHRNGPYGHFVLAHQGRYHYKSMRRLGPLVVIRSYGHKLEIPFKSASGTGRAAAVAIGRSLKRWRA